MTVKPFLGGWEVPRVHSLESLEERTFVELAVPGRTGGVLQDLDARPARIAIRGSVFGEEDRNAFIEEVRAKYQSGEPLTFVADIVTATTVEHVVVELLHLEDDAGAPDQLAYLIVLKESPPPPPPPDPFGGIDAGLLDQAGDLLDSVTGALDVLDTLGSVPDFGDPSQALGGALSGVESALGDLDGVTSALTELFGTG